MDVTGTDGYGGSSFIRTLESEVSGGNASRLSWWLDDHKGTVRATQIQSAIVAAAKSGWPEGMSILYTYARENDAYKGWDRCNREVYRVIAEKRDDACWDVAWQNNQQLPPECRAGVDEIADVFSASKYRYGIDDLLGSKMQPEQTFEFRQILSAALAQGLYLGLVARHALRFDGGQAVLDEAFAQMMNAGSVAPAETLFNAGARMTEADSKLFQTAVESDNAKMLELMEKSGVPMQECVDRFLPQFRYGVKVFGEVEFYLDSFKSGIMHRIASSAQELRSLRDRFSIVDGDTLKEGKYLGSAGTLTILFNFTTRQQMVLAPAQHSGGGGVSVVNFSDIDNQQALQRAADIFVVMGGKPQMVEDIGKRIDKKRLPLSPK